jgi:DNA-binding Lrp family transcriptional regulator
VTESWWSDVDDAVLNELAAAGGRLTLAELASGLGMSEDGVRSIVAMLAERNSIRIVEVELARPRASPRAGAGGAALGRRVSAAPRATVRRRRQDARASDRPRVLDPRRAESPPPGSGDDVDPAVDV